jgi:hypothetical protein
METTRHCVWLSAVGLIFLLSLTWVAQGQRQVSDAPRGLFSGLPGVLSHQIAALGDRARSVGKERVVLNGEFSDDLGRRFPVRVTLQLPEWVRLEGFNPGGLPLTFEEANVSRGQTRADEKLLETFSMDTPEGMFASIRRGGAVQLAGLRFGPDHLAMPHYSGPRYDIYDVTHPVEPDGSSPGRLRRYYFDSETGLLASTQYINELQAVHVETRFSNWQIVEHSAFPTNVERLENGRVVFAFRFNKVAAEPRQDPTRLSIPEEPVALKEE